MLIWAPAVLLLVVGCCDASNDARFSPHEYGCSRFSNYLGPQKDWRSDLDSAFRKGDFTVVFHGVAGAGKSSLTAMLCGSQDGLLIGPKLSRDGTNSLTAQSRIYQCRSQNTKHPATINVIDTPGFSEPNKVGQIQTLQGVDCAHQLALKKVVPLKRIYFLLDWSSNHPIPENLAGYLRVLLLRYGPSIASCVRFVVSKCDVLQLDTSDTQQWVERVHADFQQVFNLEPSSKTVLFVAVKSSQNARQLTRDLSAASNEQSGYTLQATLCPGGTSTHLKKYMQLYDRLDHIIRYYKKFKSVRKPDEKVHLSGPREPNDVATLQESIDRILPVAWRVADLLDLYEIDMEHKSSSELIAGAATCFSPAVATPLLAFGAKHRNNMVEANRFRNEVYELTGQDWPADLAHHCK